MTTPYAYQRDGAVLVLADGPELLVYSGANDAPLWKKFCEGILVAVGATAEHVLALDTDGTLEYYRILDGEKADQVRFDSYVRHLDVAASGLAAAVAQDSVQIVRPRGDPATIPVPKARVLAFGPEGDSLGVGCADGTFHAIDPNTGGAWGSCVLGGPVKGVAWSATGKWLVTVGTDIVMVAGDGTAEVGRIPIAGAELGAISCTRDGVLVAAVQGKENVVIYELKDNTSVGLVAAKREVGGIAFGPGTWLGVGFDDGDGNRVDLTTGQSTRTEAHPGRAQNSWGLGVRVEKEAIRGALAWVRAGGEPIASRIKHAWDEPRRPGQIDPSEEKKGGCLRTVVILLVLFFVCTGCGGLATGGWYWYSGGV